MTTIEQSEQNAALAAVVKYRARLLCRVLKAAFPACKFEIAWGAAETHGMQLPGAVPPNATFRFGGLVVAIRHFNAQAQVRVTASPSVVMDPTRTFALDPSYPYLTEAAAAPGTPQPSPSPQPVVPPDDVPDPYKPPVYCWPCADKIYTA